MIDPGNKELKKRLICLECRKSIFYRFRNHLARCHQHFSHEEIEQFVKKGELEEKQLKGKVLENEIFMRQDQHAWAPGEDIKKSNARHKSEDDNKKQIDDQPKMMKTEPKSPIDEERDILY